MLLWGCCGVTTGDHCCCCLLQRDVKQVESVFRHRHEPWIEDGLRCHCGKDGAAKVPAMEGRSNKRKLSHRSVVEIEVQHGLSLCEESRCGVLREKPHSYAFQRNVPAPFLTMCEPRPACE